MTPYDRLLAETAIERDRFLARPLIRRALESGVPAGMYLDFLGQAYHHVRQTCPLLGLALSRCSDRDVAYRQGLLDYIAEEMGHEAWILDDIAALGGDAETVRHGRPGIPCRAMIAYVTWAIEHVSPYAMLGMVHVLEGLSVALAERAAVRIREAIGGDRTGSPDAGFRYLTSHGALDQAHVRSFIHLINGIRDPDAADAIVQTANAVYRLYGDMFAELAGGERAARTPIHVA